MHGTAAVGRGCSRGNRAFPAVNPDPALLPPACHFSPRLSCVPGMPASAPVPFPTLLWGGDGRNRGKTPRCHSRSSRLPFLVVPIAISGRPAPTTIRPPACLPLVSSPSSLIPRYSL